METFRDMIIETPKNSVRVTLKKPMTLTELWEHCTKAKRRPLPILTLSGGLARIAYDRAPSRKQRRAR